MDSTCEPVSRPGPAAGREPRPGLALAAALLLLGTAAACGEAPEKLRAPGKDDRLLVLAPHEDDETIAAGGAIQQAAAAGAAVRVVYLTYGDHNEFAFMLYRKWPLLTPAENRKMGETRRAEAVRATALLGLRAAQLVFFGYPDHGTLTIWREHWGEAPPLRSHLTATSEVPYPDAANAGQPYKGEAVLADVKKQLEDFRPTRIVAPHPADANPDHAAGWLFLQLALLELNPQPAPEVYAYPVHVRGYPPRADRRTPALLDPPEALRGERGWTSLPLTEDQVKRKAEAIRVYRTQTVARPGFLAGFARANELFQLTPPRTLPRVGEGPALPLVATGTQEGYEAAGPPAAGLLRVAGTAGGLRLEAEAGEAVRLELFAYRRGRPFAESPKLQVSWRDRALKVTDRGKPVDTELKPEASDRQVRAEIPWKLLDDPDALFVHLQELREAGARVQTGWYVFRRAGAGAAGEKP